MAHQLRTHNPFSICLLGHGTFADTAFSLIRTRYPIVDADAADVYVVCNYGKILTQEELDTPRYGALNIHPSLLPHYRGATPIQSAIAHGDTHTGVTIIKMDEKVDHGPIYAQKECLIDPDDTFDTLSTKLALIAASLIVDTIDKVIVHAVSPSEQNHTRATCTQKVTQPMYINQHADDRQSYNTIRAYAHEPGVFVQLTDCDLKILTARLIDGHIEPILVQRPGKKAIQYDEFARGYSGVLPFSLS